MVVALAHGCAGPSNLEFDPGGCCGAGPGGAFTFAPTSTPLQPNQYYEIRCATAMTNGAVHLAIWGPGLDDDCSSPAAAIAAGYPLIAYAFGTCTLDTALTFARVGLTPGARGCVYPFLDPPPMEVLYDIPAGDPVPSAGGQFHVVPEPSMPETVTFLLDTTWSPALP